MRQTAITHDDETPMEWAIRTADSQNLQGAYVSACAWISALHGRVDPDERRRGLARWEPRLKAVKALAVVRGVTLT